MITCTDLMVAESFTHGVDVIEEILAGKNGLWHPVGCD
jgi:hypothetical protein